MKLRLAALAASLCMASGCLSVARMEDGSLQAVIPVSGSQAKSGWARVGNAAAAAAPFADYILPGAGALLTTVLGAGGWGAYRDFKGEQKARERENKAWDEATATALNRQAPPIVNPNGGAA